AYLESSPILPRFRAKCTVIPFGIKQEPFRKHDNERVQAVRKQYGPGPLVLFAGVLRYYKGLTYLLQAMRSVNATLLVVGDGPQSAVLRQQALDLGLTHKVFFTGRVSDEELIAYYHAADCFVLPASERSEAFGLVLVEALASGLPIISTELAGGTSYVNLDGESGIVVPPKDPQALALALNRLLSDDALRRRLAQGAQARAALFEVDRMVQQIQDVYMNLIEAD
ncbi:MAG: glycosyltransferase, partial [Chloroflexi bacterium]|nr:glycosyltransferase [Chloroflexota bacterium]